MFTDQSKACEMINAFQSAVKLIQEFGIGFGGRCCQVSQDNVLPLSIGHFIIDCPTETTWLHLQRCLV